ncbi:MAG TPA: FHA domain-containing protein, partial [Candidatus Limnocylindrales bacterium]|nr:FHA domain-containing protein [Candidatus Limnocylindrales bacterium]
AESNVHSMSGVPMGTFAYMSPEQAEAEKVDSRADIYALGIQLYELTAGRLPYQPRSITEAIRMHSREPLPRPSEQRPGFPPDLERIIIKSTAKNPNDRYQSAGDMARDLSRIKGGGSASAGIEAPAVPVASAGAPPPASPPRPPADKVIVTGPNGSQTYDLSSGTLTIGRESDSDITLPTGKVSRNHARIERKPDGTYQVIDLGSTNGTFVNEARAGANAPQVWAAGVPMRIADYQFRLEPANAPPAAAPAAAAPDLGFTLLEAADAPQAAPPAAPAAPPKPTAPSFPPAGPSMPPGFTPYVPPVSSGPYAPTPSTPPMAPPPPPSPYSASGVYAPAGSSYGGPPPGGDPSGAGQLQQEREQIMLTIMGANVIKVDPGSRATMSLEMLNESPLVDHFTFEITGLPEEWYSFPAQTLYLMPKGRDTTQLSFHPPRNSRSKAGQHPFEIRAVARAQGLKSVAQQGVLHITPFSTFIIELNPQRQKKRKAKYELMIENKGNMAAAYRLDARDREELLNYQISSKQLTIPAGEKQIVPIDVAARKRTIVGTSQSLQFEVQVQPEEEGQQAQRLTAELVNPALLPPWLLGLMGLSTAGIMAMAINAVRNIDLSNQQATATIQVIDMSATPMAIAATQTAIALSDPDSDGLTNAQEAELGTDPDNPDTDGDGLIDGLERVPNACDPLKRDTDGDTLTDGAEVGTGDTVVSYCDVQDSDGDGARDDVDPSPLTVATATPSPEPTAAPNECLDAPPIQLSAPSIARVTLADGSGVGNQPVRIRVDPGTGNRQIDQIPVGQTMRVLEGPQCGSDGRLRWWFVEWNGVQGWVADGVGEEYYIEPIPQ